MKVGIVGGGITGLALHHHLEGTGIESVVFESASEPGGVIRSGTVDGRTIDHGPQRTRLTPPVAALIDDVGVRDAMIEAEELPTFVYHDGRLRRVPFSFREAARTDLLSWRGKLRTLLEPLTGPPRDDETVREALVRMVGSEVADRAIGPLYSGLYASHPAEMYARHSLSRVLEKRGISRSLLAAALRATLRGSDPPPVISFEDGLQTLPAALHRAHESSVEVGTSVESLHNSDGRFVLETSAGDRLVDAVVLTTPADVTGGIVEPVAPDAAARLRDLSYNPLAVVHLASECELAAAGYQVQFEEDLRTLGVTATASLFGRDGVYTCYLGGWKTPELVEWSDRRLGETAARDFETVTGHEARALAVHRLSRGMPAYDRTWTNLEGMELPAGVHLCANYESRAGIPGRITEARTLAESFAEGRTPSG